MAQQVFADPFGSYVQGQERGLRQTALAGQTARQFRDSDLNADFMKWYQPYRQREAAAGTSEAELGLNKNLLGYTGQLANAGQGAEDPYLKFLQSQGIDTSQFHFNNPTEALMRTGMASGAISPALLDPNVAMAGHYGISRVLPQEMGAGAGQPQPERPNPILEAFKGVPGFTGGGAGPQATGAPQAPPHMQANPYTPRMPGVYGGSSTLPGAAPSAGLKEPRSPWAGEYEQQGGQQ